MHYTNTVLILAVVLLAQTAGAQEPQPRVPDLFRAHLRGGARHQAGVRQQHRQQIPLQRGRRGRTRRRDLAPRGVPVRRLFGRPQLLQALPDALLLQAQALRDPGDDQFLFDRPGLAR